MNLSEVKTLASARAISQTVREARCAILSHTHRFDQECSVYKRRGQVDCRHRPGDPCSVKDATALLNRTGDMGRLPISAWFHLWRANGLRELLRDVCEQQASPTSRAEQLVLRICVVHRVGRKLATLFVSSLSTPALAPGLTPWFPAIDGNSLVVVDTNVSRAVDALRRFKGPMTYAARAKWLISRAEEIDLRQCGRDLPEFSPRLLQQAVYAFASKSNRLAHGTACDKRRTGCRTCAPLVCPFA